MLHLLDLYVRRKDLQRAFPEVLSKNYDRLLEWALGVVQKRWEDSDHNTLKTFGDRFESLLSLRTILDPALNEWRYRFYQKFWKEKVEKDYAQKGHYWAVGSTDEKNYLETGRKMYASCLLSGLKEVDTVLDFGCGNGRLAQYLQGFLRGKYYGVDISEILIEDAKKKISSSNFTFLVNERPTLHFPDRYFDFICAFSVITHLDIEYTKELLQEWKRLLKPGGNLCVSFIPNKSILSFAGDIEKMEHNPAFLLRLAIGIGFRFVDMTDPGLGQLLLHLTL